MSRRRPLVCRMTPARRWAWAKLNRGATMAVVFDSLRAPYGDPTNRRVVGEVLGPATAVYGQSDALVVRRSDNGELVTISLATILGAEHPDYPGRGLV